MVVKHPVHKDRYMFENLTVHPYCRELLDLNLLSPNDIKYLNDFNKKCEEKVLPLLAGNDLAIDYFKRQCAPLEYGKL